MAIKAKENKTIGDKFSIAINTEEKFARMLLTSNSKGLLDTALTDKQINNLQGFVGVISKKPDQTLLHNSAETHGKLRMLISTGDTQSPLMQQQKSSERVNEVTRQLNIAKEIAEARANVVGDVTGEMYGYMLTLTRPNTHKGKLDADYRKHRSRVSKLLRRLYDGTRRNNGLQLIGGEYLGAYVSHEVTVNKERMDNKDGQKLYHPHTHVIIFADSLLDVQATKEVLLSAWRAQNKDLSLSAKAFDFVPTYDSKKPQTADLSVSAIAEAVKYSVKPDTWYNLDNVRDDFSVEVFAELYNSVKRKKLKQSHGVMLLAAEFMSEFEFMDNAIGMALMDEMPDLLTQISDLIFNPNKGVLGAYNAVYRREMTRAELIHYNSGFIEEALVDAGLEEEIEQFMNDYFDLIQTEREKIFAEVFRSITFVRTLNELTDKFERFAQKAENLKDDFKAYDIRLFKDALFVVKDNGDVDTGYLDSHTNDNYESRFGFLIPNGWINTELKQEFNAIRTLYSEHVAPLTGKHATIDNHNAFGDFMQTQGISSSDMSFNIGLSGSERFIDPFVNCKNIQDRLGWIFFGDDWESVKKPKATALVS